MSAEKIWKVTKGEGVKVAVIDSGVSDETPSLNGQVLGNEVGGKAGFRATEDYAGHGTTIAEMIAGTGSGGGLQGIAPGAKILPYRINTGDELKDEGEIRQMPSIAEAIRAAADSDAKIINMSFEGPAKAANKEAVNYAYSKGKLLIAGVGNSAEKDNEIGYPAAYANVVGVAALGKSGDVGKFSEHGKHVDLAAPGLQLPVWCDATFKKYCPDNSGTSLSTAYASASAALIWSAHPDWTSNQVLKVLIDTAGRDWPKDRPSNYLGYGVVRPARNLIMNQGEPGPADVDPITGAKNAVPAGGGAAGGEDAPNSDTKPESGTDPSGSETGSSQDTDGTSTDGSEAKESAAESNSGGNTGLWIGLGGVAAVIVLGGAGYAVSRRRG